MILLFCRRGKKRTTLLLLSIILIFLLNIHHLGFQSNSRKDQLISKLKDTNNNNKAKSYIHNKFLHKYPIESIYDLSINQRCDLFFKFLTKIEPQWTIDPLNHYTINYDDENYDEFVLKNGFELTMKFENENNKLNSQSEEYGEKIRKFFKQEYFKKESKSNQIEINNRITITRLFSHCYINPLLKGSSSSSSSNEQQKSKNIKDLKAFENRVNPWLDKEFPTYENWNGELRKLKMTNDELILNQYKNSSSGKGIVITLSEKHVNDTISLIHTLRGLNNKLPIEIIHTGLSKISKERLINSARDKYHDNLITQEIWFVNINKSIINGYRSIFRKFDFKILSMLFNSFEEFILVDADSVIFKNPNYFFNIKGYKETGAFFFKDRGVLIPRKLEDGEYLSYFAPSLIDTALFGIPQLTNHTLNNPFFKGLVHYQESGLLVINKNRHFHSILMVIQLLFIHPVSKKSMGDKELYWMGFSLNGDEKYVFNENWAAAIGSITPNEDRIRSSGEFFKSKQICSSHPGHINSQDDSLLWMNTGFKVCGKNITNYQDELIENKKMPIWKHIKTGEEIEKFYNSQVKITHAIIPPLDGEYRLRYSFEQEPSDGWSCPIKICKNYMWCGYSSIGGEKNTLNGRIITFNNNEMELFEYLGDLWLELQ